MAGALSFVCRLAIGTLMRKSWGFGPPLDRSHGAEAVLMELGGIPGLLRCSNHLSLKRDAARMALLPCVRSVSVQSVGLMPGS